MATVTERTLMPPCWRRRIRRCTVVEVIGCAGVVRSLQVGGRSRQYLSVPTTLECSRARGR